MRRLAPTLLVLLSLGACSLTDLSGLQAVDGGTQSGDATAKSFALTVDPNQASLGVTDKISVKVHADRSTSFNGPIDVKVTGLPASGVSATSTVILANQNDATFDLQVVDDSAGVVKLAMKIVGLGNNESATADFTLDVRGAEFYSSTPGTVSYVVPAGVTSVEVKAWGAGGGGGGPATAPGGDGGPGGFVSATILPVTPKETLTLVIGSGGVGGTVPGNGSGGGGGGFSAVMRGPTYVMVAGGGGGAGAGRPNADGGRGGAGGGASGTAGYGGVIPHTTLVNDGAGQPGTATGGGAGCGNRVACGGVGYLAGPGRGNNGSIGNGSAGGKPAGAAGAVNYGGGGGGGGRFGGGGGDGGGNSNPVSGGGGGGGSGIIPATDAVSIAGTTVPPMTSDKDYADGAGEGGKGGSGGLAGYSGKSGRIVIHPL